MANKRLTDIFRELARIDGLPGKEGALAGHLLSYLKSLGLPAQVDGTAAAALSNTGNVLCKVGGGGNFLLAAHMDTSFYTSATVPVLTPEKISGDGRGQLGVERAGMAAILYAVERAVHTNQPIKPFTLAFTTRHRPSMAGVRHLQLPESVRFAFVFASQSAPGAYSVSSRGVANFSADVLGRSADGSEPEKGVCAVTLAARAIAGLKLGRHDPETTSNIGTITGGSGPSSVPLAALVRGQLRAARAEKAEPILNGIKEAFQSSASAGGGAAAFKWSWEYAPYSHASGDEVCGMASDALIAAGLKPLPEPAVSGSEANVLNGRGIAAVNFGIGIKGSQTNNESIRLDDLSKAAEIVSQLIRR